MKENWKKLNNRQIIKTITMANKNQTIFVIVPKNYKKLVVPLFCPLCFYPMNTKEDVSAYKKHHLCEKCSYKWDYKNIKNIIHTKEFEEYLNNLLILKRPKINLK